MEMKPFEAPAASVAVVFLTPRCNMDCPYCGSESTFAEFTRGDARTLVDYLSCEGFESVVFGGGEPTLWRGGLREICAAARARGLLTQVGTNALSLPADVSEWREVDRWVIPLEAGEPSAHDRLRPSAGSHFVRVMEALDLLAPLPSGITVSSVARPGADGDLEGVAALLENRVRRGMRLHAWHLYRFQPMGRNGADNAARFQQTDEAWGEQVRTLRHGHPGLPLLLRPDMMHSKRVAFFWRSRRDTWRQGPGPLHGLAPLKSGGYLALEDEDHHDIPYRGPSCLKN